MVRDGKGEIYSVRYEAVNAMLLNEFLKEHRKVEQQEATMTQLSPPFQSRKRRSPGSKRTSSRLSRSSRRKLKLLSARLDEQASQIRKVSDQFGAASPLNGGLQVSRYLLQKWLPTTKPKLTSNNR